MWLHKGQLLINNMIQQELDMPVSSRWHVPCPLMLWPHVIPWWCKNPWHIWKGLKLMHANKLHDCIMLYWQLKTVLLWKSKFNPCDPKLPPGWPLTPQFRSRGSQAYVYAWILYLWSSYVTWASYRHFGKNNLLTPVTPNDPRLTYNFTK